jgi:hypothetical protein
MAAHSSPPKSSSPGSGAAAGGVSTTVPSAGARSACVCRSIFWKVKTSPGKITTASDHVAPLDSDGQFAPGEEDMRLGGKLRATSTMPFEAPPDEG